MRPQGVSTALYGWMERFARDGVAWDWESLYSACARSGVDAVETDATDAKRAILDRLGLRVSASYIGMPLGGAFVDLEVHDRVLPVARRLAAAGGTVLLLNADGAHASGFARKTDSEVRRQGENLSRLADLVDPLGLRVALHNHADEYDAAARDLASVVEHADPTVGLCIDTAWAIAAGHDPVMWAQEFTSRVLAVHLRNVREGVPTETLFDGEFDVDRFLSSLEDYRGWLTLELWHPEPLQPVGDMESAVRMSTDRLRHAVA